MKHIVRIVKVIAAAYLALSLLASLAVALWPSLGWDIVTHRAPLLIVEIVNTTVELDEDSEFPAFYGITDDGFYLEFGPDALPGERVTSLIFWNPLTNYEDDIIARYDIASEI